MVRTVGHRREDSADELRRRAVVEQVVHRIDEDPTRLTPAFRQLEEVRVQGDRAPVTVARKAHGL